MLRKGEGRGEKEREEVNREEVGFCEKGEQAVERLSFLETMKEKLENSGQN